MEDLGSRGIKQLASDCGHAAADERHGEDGDATQNHERTDHGQGHRAHESQTDARGWQFNMI